MKLFDKSVLFLLVSCSGFLFSQKTQKDSIDFYFKQIENLVQNKDSYKEDFLNVETLLAKKENTEGAEKVKVLLDLYTANIFKSTDLATDYNNEALKLAADIGDINGELSAKYNKAYLLFVGGYFDDSMRLATELGNVVNKDVHPQIYSNVETLKSYIRTEKGEFDLALQTGLQLLDFGEKKNSFFVLMRAYSALSHYYLRTENYSKALSYCLKGLHYIIKLREIHFIFPKIDEIARMSAKLGNPNEALKAYAYYLEVEKEIAPPGDYIQSIVYMNMAEIYTSNQEYKKAQKYLSKALEIINDNDYRFRTPRALVLQARLYLNLKDTVNTILYFEKSVEAAESINAYDVVKSSSGILAKLYEETNQLSKAYEYSSLNKAIIDSLFTDEKEQKIIILETKRKIKEITQEQKVLELENEAQRAKYRTIMVFLAFLSIICLIAIYAYVKVKKKNRLLYLRTLEVAEVKLEVDDELKDVKIQNTKETDTSENSVSNKPNQEIDEDIKFIIMSKLERLEKEKFFLDSNCSLRNLALQLKTNPKYLSQVINQEKKCHFNYYINELRINHLLSRLLKEKDFRESKLGYIAVSVGFNNLNTFNSAFKKRQGILPSYFIRKLIQDHKEDV